MTTPVNKDGLMPPRHQRSNSSTSLASDRSMGLVNTALNRSNSLPMTNGLIGWAQDENISTLDLTQLQNLITTQRTKLGEYGSQMFDKFKKTMDETDKVTLESILEGDIGTFEDNDTTEMLRELAIEDMNLTDDQALKLSTEISGQSTEHSKLRYLAATAALRKILDEEAAKAAAKGDSSVVDVVTISVTTG